MAAIGHTKSITAADATGTVTFWNGATTSSAAATAIVRPSDWNSAHYFTQTISGAAGNTYGTSTFAGSNLVYGFTGHQYGSVSTENGAATLWFGENVEPGGYTAYTYNNRQLGASTQRTLANNAIWLSPFRIAGAPVSASTMLLMQSFSGSVSSATTGTYAQTNHVGIYSQHTDPASSARFDSVWTTSRTMSFVGSGTGSGGWAYDGGGSSGNNSTVVRTQIYGLRMHEYNIGSVVPTGLYLFAMRQSTSSAQYSLIVHTTVNGWLMDAPVPAGQGRFNSAATFTSLGYVDGGTYATTSTNLPASLNITGIQQVSNIVPWFKIGAL